MRTPEEWFEIERKASEHLELIGEVARLNGEVARLQAKLVEVTANRATIHARWLDKQAEVKRLREERAGTEGAIRIMRAQYDDMVKRAEAAEAEVERLRAALQRIVDRLDHADKIKRPVDGLGVAMGHDARIALRGEGEKP